MRKFRFEKPKFYGYSDHRSFSDWLADIEYYFDNYEMSDLSKIRFAESRLVGPTKFYWDSITNARKRLCRKHIELWEEMKLKLKERYIPDFYMNHLVNELHNPHKSQHIASSIDIGESKIFEDVSVLFAITSVEDTSIDSCPSKIASVIKNISIDSFLSPSSLDEVYISLEDASNISDVVGAYMESSTPITDEIYVHEDNQDS